MHCSKCKTVIEKGVMIMDNSVLESYYCKKCFAKEFMDK